MFQNKTRVNSRLPGFIHGWKVFMLPFLLCLQVDARSQQEFLREASISISAGLINYQGDLNPNSFTIAHSNVIAGISLHKPISRWFAARAGINVGRAEAGSLQSRLPEAAQLEFYSTIKEAYAAIEIDLLDIDKTKVYLLYLRGIAVFHFNPWA
jgi:hypothetical protein